MIFASFWNFFEIFLTHFFLHSDPQICVLPYMFAVTVPLQKEVKTHNLTHTGNKVLPKSRTK